MTSTAATRQTGKLPFNHGRKLVRLRLVKPGFKKRGGNTHEPSGPMVEDLNHFVEVLRTRLSWEVSERGDKAELGRRTGAAPQTITRLMTKTRNPSILTLLRLAPVVGLVIEFDHRKR